MVLIPIIGANILALKDFSEVSGPADISFMVLFTGFVVAFISGFIACKWMLSIVRKGKLLYFAAYCLVLGLTAIFFL
jgi:undecaprenyl-diphosphatase